MSQISVIQPPVPSEDLVGLQNVIEGISRLWPVLAKRRAEGLLDLQDQFVLADAPIAVGLDFLVRLYGFYRLVFKSLQDVHDGIS